MKPVLEELRAFTAAAQTGSFSAAARSLGKAQSVVSVQIASLESDLGFKLFERGHKLKITKRGEELLPSARLVVIEADRFALRAVSLAATPVPVHYMGIDFALESPAMLDIMAKFAAAFPETRLQVENMASSEAAWFFKQSAMTMALVFSQKTWPDIEETTIGVSPAAIVVARKHPLAEGPLTAERLREYRQIVVRAGEGEMATLTDGAHPSSWQVDRSLMALGLASRGVGWTILPAALVVTQPSAAGKVIVRKPPIELAPQRLVLRAKPGETPAAIFDWWLKAMKSAVRRFGVEPVSSTNSEHAAPT